MCKKNKKKNKMGCVSKTMLDSPILLPNKTNRLVTTEGGWLSGNGLVSGIEDTTRDWWLMSFPRKSTVYWLFGLYGEPTANTHTHTPPRKHADKNSLSRLMHYMFWVILSVRLRGVVTAWHRNRQLQNLFPLHLYLVWIKGNKCFTQIQVLLVHLWMCRFYRACLTSQSQGFSTYWNTRLRTRLWYDDREGRTCYKVKDKRLRENNN